MTAIHIAIEALFAGILTFATIDGIRSILRNPLPLDWRDQ